MLCPSIWKESWSTSAQWKRLESAFFGSCSDQKVGKSFENFQASFPHLTTTPKTYMWVSLLQDWHFKNFTENTINSVSSLAITLSFDQESREQSWRARKNEEEKRGFNLAHSILLSGWDWRLFYLQFHHTITAHHLSWIAVAALTNKLFSLFLPFLLLQQNGYRRWSFKDQQDRLRFLGRFHVSCLNLFIVTRRRLCVFDDDWRVLSLLSLFVLLQDGWCFRCRLKDRRCSNWKSQAFDPEPRWNDVGIHSTQTEDEAWAPWKKSSSERRANFYFQEEIVKATCSSLPCVPYWLSFILLIHCSFFI